MENKLADKILTPPQKLWLETIYSKSTKNEAFNRKTLRVELFNSLPKGFEPNDINGRFLRGGTNLTLLGTALINPKSYLVGNADKIIKTINQLIKSDSEIDRITSQEIYQKTKISESDVQIILQMLAEIGFYHSHGLSNGDKGLVSITIDEEAFKGYLQYPSISECLNAVVEGIHNQQIIDMYYGKPPFSQQIKTEIIEEEKIDSRKVFVVHGRNWEARNALFNFLRSIGLHPLEWSEAVKATGKASPYVGEVLDTAFSTAQAVVVLFTPDDEARLLEPFRNSDDENYETELTPQARPNVLFEAGMAMGRNPDRTVLVELGKMRKFSDIGGRHIIRLNGSTQRRQELAQRLETAGCSINLIGVDWHTDGNFDGILENINANSILKQNADKTNLDSLEQEVKYELNPIFEYQRTFLSQSENEQYSLSIKLRNEGTKTIKEFRVDILFPNDFLNQHTMNGLEVNSKRTNTHRLFRILPDFNSNRPLYPGDEISPIIGFEVSNEQKESDALNQKLILEIFVEDEKVMSIQKEISEFVSMPAD